MKARSVKNVLSTTKKEKGKKKKLNWKSFLPKKPIPDWGWAD